MAHTPEDVDSTNQVKKEGGSEEIASKEKDYTYSYDAEAIPGEGKLKRQLKNRHIAMISIGGVIGTGLFLGTGGSLQNGGPVGLLLAYIVRRPPCRFTWFISAYSYSLGYGCK